MNSKINKRINKLDVISELTPMIIFRYRITQTEPVVRITNKQKNLSITVVKIMVKRGI